MKLSKPITELLDDNNIEWAYAPKEAVEKSISSIKEMMGRIGFECEDEDFCNITINYINSNCDFYADTVFFYNEKLFSKVSKNKIATKENNSYNDLYSTNMYSITINMQNAIA